MPTLISEISTLVSYYGATMTDSQIELYLDALADIDADSLHAGIVDLIKSSKWMPKVSEIRQAAQAAQERIYDGKVLALHDELNRRRLSSPWREDMRGVYVTDGKPAVIDEQVCPNGHIFANWTACPECNEDAI